MAGPYDLSERIRNLVARDQATLVRRLLILEALRLNLKLGGVNVTQRVNVADEGQDGAVLDVPEELETILPAGQSLLQMKTTKDKGTLEADLPGEIAKKRPQEMLSNGGSYILVWSQDATDKERDAIKDLMVDAAGEKYRDQIHVWPASTIEQLCNTNAAVLVEFGMVPQFDVQPFSKWAVGQVQEVSAYVADEKRSEAIEQIRRAIIERDDAVILRLQGDAGVGKSRLLREALDVEGLRDQVIVGPAEDVSGFINYVIANDSTRCILVADDVDAADVDRLRKLIQPAEGRIRLITAGLPPADRASVLGGEHDIQLGTLDHEALLKLIKEEVGIPEDRARWVADLSAGYPRLAIFVAKALQQNPETYTIGEALTNQDINEFLKRMLPADLQKHLSIVALFSQVGVEGPREHEIKAVGEAFSVDYAVLVDTLNGEVGRFVSPAGDLRSVTPKLVAVFLARQILKERGSAIAEQIKALPDPLPDRFRQQLIYLREAPAIRTVVKGLLADREFKEPQDFDGAAAGFLRVAAAVDPEQAAQALEQVMSVIDDEGLKKDSFPRRDVVGTLEYLLWSPATYEFAVTQLLRLAENETESFANNSRGVLVDSFQSFLGGTVVPHRDRLVWLDGQVEGDMTDLRREILSDCAAAGLRGHQTRFHGTYVDEAGVRDWHPSSREEAVEVVTESWGRLVRFALEATGEGRNRPFENLVNGVRSAFNSGINDEIFSALTQDGWSPDEKAKLAAPLRDVLKYDEPDDDLRAQLNEAIAALMGDSFEEQLGLVLRTQMWDLHEDEDWKKTRPSIVQLAEEAAKDEAKTGAAMSLTNELQDQQTAFAFWLEYARRTDPKELASLALDRDDPVLPAYQAALLEAQNDPDWVDSELEKAFEGGPTAERAVPLVQSAGLTNKRTQLLLGAIEAGTVARDALPQLLYGAPIRGLETSIALDLVKATAAAGSGVALENALGMLHQFAEDGEGLEEDAEVQGLALDLAQTALSTEGGTGMKAHYAYEVAKWLPAADSLKVLEARLKNDRTLPDPPEIDLLNRAFQEDPAGAWEWARGILESAFGDEGYERWAMWTESLNLLSYMGRAEPEATLAWFTETPQEKQLRLLSHADFGTGKPDEFVRQLLDKTEDEDLRESASVCFFNSLGTVTGPFYLGLERQLERAKVWRGEFEGHGKAWADDLIRSFERQIPEQKRRDEEDQAMWG